MIQHQTENKSYLTLWLIGQLGIPLLGGLQALAESRTWKAPLRWAGQGAGLLALAGYYFWLAPRVEEQVDVVQYFTLLISAHLFVAVAAYSGRGSVDDFWHFNKQLFGNVILGAAFSAIIFGGLSLALLAVNELFDFHLSEKVFLRLFAFITLIFNTLYFYFHFPKGYEYGDEESGYVTVFRHLCKFILIPIVLLYFVILYTYAAKVLFTWDLPHGWISSLVIGFSVAGIFTWLLNFFLPLYDTNLLVQGFRRWFWWVVLPMCVLLFVGIGYRINQYGVTEQRFLVAHTGFWLTLNCLYFLFSKKDNIKFIPLSLLAFALLYSFGPFNAFRSSERSQISRLKTALEQNGRLKEGKMVKNASPMPPTDAQKAMGALEYLQGRDALSKLSDMLPMPLDSFGLDYGRAQKIGEWLNIGSSGTAYVPTQYSISCPECRAKWYQVKGFTQLIPLQVSAGEYRDSDEKGERFYLSEDFRSLEWVKDAQVIARYPLDGLISTLKGRSKEAVISMTPNDNGFDLSPAQAGQKKIRLLVTGGSIDVEKPEGGVAYLEGMVLSN